MWLFRSEVTFLNLNWLQNSAVTACYHKIQAALFLRFEPGQLFALFPVFMPSQAKLTLSSSYMTFLPT